MNDYSFNARLYTLRMEYFGGLLINKQTMVKYEISKYDVIFLLGVKRGLSVNSVLKMIENEFNVVFQPDLEIYIKLRIIGSREEVESDTGREQEIFADILREFESVKTKKYLRAPVELTIYPSLKCQLQCSFCFLHKKKNEATIEHNSDDWIKLVKSFIDEGTVSVSILGGEPSLYSDIVPLINKLDKLGIRFTLTTNGQNWSEELYKSVINAKHLTPIVSIESFEIDQSEAGKTHYADPRKAAQLVRRLCSDGKHCRINTVYMGQQDKEIFDILDFCIENNVEKYSVSICFGIDDKTPSIMETNLLKDRVKEYLHTKKNGNLYVTFEGCMIYSSYSDIDGSIVKTEYQKKQYGCECGNTILEILSDGNMYSCAAYISQAKPIGNAFTQSWKDIWDYSEELKRLRFQKCSDPICMECSLYHFCNGGCPAYKEMKGLDGRVAYDTRCMIHKIKAGEKSV